METMVSSYTVSEASDKLTKAFSLMRKKGLIARQRFSCCRSCAGYELANYVSETIDKYPTQKEKIKGCVFYTRQSSFFADINRWNKRPISIYLSFGQVGTEKHGDVGLSTVEVGKVVTACLTEAGLAWKWNGDENESIEVLPEMKAANTCSH